MFVCVAPLLYEPMAAAQATSMEWYCSARTGVTYILAVLASHTFSFAVATMQGDGGLMGKTKAAAAPIGSYKRVPAFDELGEEGAGGRQHYGKPETFHHGLRTSATLMLGSPHGVQRDRYKLLRFEKGKR